MCVVLTKSTDCIDDDMVYYRLNRNRFHGTGVVLSSRLDDCTDAQVHAAAVVDTNLLLVVIDNRPMDDAGTAVTCSRYRQQTFMWGSEWSPFNRAPAG